MAARLYGRVYFIHAPSVRKLKIGTGIIPIDRFNAIRMISPVDVELLGTIDGGRIRERKLHEMFKDRHSHGEWFNADDDMLKSLRAMIDAESSAIALAETLVGNLDRRSIGVLMDNLELTETEDILAELANILGASIMDRRYEAAE